MYTKARHFNQEIIILSPKYFSLWTCWDHSPFLLADCWFQEWPVAARPPTFALSRFLLLWSNTMDKTFWGGKGLFHLALPCHSPSLKGARAGAEGGNLEAGADMEVMEGPLLTGLLLMASSACFLQSPGMVLCPEEEAHPHQQLVRKVLQGQSGGGIVSAEVLSSRVILVRV